MYRAFQSAMRISCAAALVMFLTAPMVAGHAHNHGYVEEGAAIPKESEELTSSTTYSESRTERSQSESQRAIATTQPAYQRVNHIIGRPVYGIQDQRIGTITDIVLDGHDSIGYVVLTHGGFLGFREKVFAVPWSEFQAHPDKEAYVLNVRKEHLQAAPGFSRDRWPETADENWSQSVQTSYREGRWDSERSGRESSEQAMTAKGEALPLNYRRVSQLIRLPAKDFQGQNLGALSDIVIGTDSHEITYGVVILDTTPWALNREMAIVPWNTIEIVPELNSLRVAADESMLKAVAFNPAGEFPYLGDPMYAQGVEKRFEATPYWETLGYIPGEGPSAREKQPQRSTTDLITTGAWSSDSAYNQRFDPELVTTVRGTISSIGSFNLAGTSVEGLRLGVKTQEGETIAVQAGPRPFIENQDIALHFGDEVTVTGAPSRIAAWRGEFLMASTIQCGDKTYHLRDADGTPLWTTQDPAGRQSSEQ